MLDARVEAVIFDRFYSGRNRVVCAWRQSSDVSRSARGNRFRIQGEIRGLNLAVPEIFNTIEQSGISRWLRESQSLFGFYFILLFHTIGMSLVVGANAVVDLRILGVATDIPLQPLKRLFAIMWTGLGINATTGLLLLTAYPTKALTNPDFYVKLSCIGIAVFIMYRMNVRVFGDASLSEAAMVAKGKVMAIWSLVFWVGAVGSGRLLSETARYFFYGHPAGG
jgi:hypothetical protein